MTSEEEEFAELISKLRGIAMASLPYFVREPTQRAADTIAALTARLADVERERDEARAAPKQRIEVDIGAVLELLQSSPELVEAMNQAAFGKIASDRIAELESALTAAQARIAEIEERLLETYQVVGSLAADAGVFKEQEVQRALTLLNDPHEKGSLLPWPVLSTRPEAAQARIAALEGMLARADGLIWLFAEHGEACCYITGEAFSETAKEALARHAARSAKETDK